jgi:hypothetical protein
MLILRGIANAENPRGQLDDEAALTYAGRLRFKGEVLDIAGDNYAGNPQVEKALERIRKDRAIAAICGFSGGGYNVRLIWKQLEPSHQGRIRKIVVIGSPGVTMNDFPGAAEVLIKADPPEGHWLAQGGSLNRSMPNEDHHNRWRGHDTRRPGDQGLARAPVDHQHRGLHGAGAKQVQGLLAGLSARPQTERSVPSLIPSSVPDVSKAPVRRRRLRLRPLGPHTGGRSPDGGTRGFFSRCAARAAPRGARCRSLKEGVRNEPVCPQLTRCETVAV